MFHVVSKRDLDLKSSLKKLERNLRNKGTTTFTLDKKNKWRHDKYPGWINWKEGYDGSVVAEIKTMEEDENEEWQIMQAFTGYLARHFPDEIESISIHFR